MSMTSEAGWWVSAKPQTCQGQDGYIIKDMLSFITSASRVYYFSSFVRALMLVTPEIRRQDSASQCGAKVCRETGAAGRNLAPATPL